MNQTRRSVSKLGVVLSGALLATLVFAAPVVFRGQAELVEQISPALPVMAAPGAPEALDSSTSAGTTFLTIQNKEGITGTVFATFYQSNGVAIDITAFITGAAGITNVIRPNGILFLDYSNATSIPAGTRGSTVVSSDVDVAVLSVNRYLPNNASSGNVGISSGDSVLSVANLRRKFQNQVDSSLTIMNTDAITRSALVEFFTDAAAGVIASKYITLPGFASTELDLGSGTDPFFTGDPDFNPVGGYRGSAKVSAVGGGAFAAVADLRRNSPSLGTTGNYTNQLLHSTNAVGQASLAQQYFAPFVRRNIVVPPNTTGFSTDIQIANPNPVTATVVVTLNVTSPGVTTAVVSFTVPANNSYVYAQNNPVPAPPLPPTMTASWEGSAIVWSSQPIAVQVRDSKLGGSTSRGTSTAYNAFSTALASNALYAPSLKRNVGTLSQRTNLRVNNIGTTAVYLRVEYVAGPGSPALTPGVNDIDWTVTTLAPGTAMNFVQFGLFRKDGTTTLPNGFYGGAKITAVTSAGGTTLDANAKIIATINETAQDVGAYTTWLDAQQYEAVK